MTIAILERINKQNENTKNNMHAEMITPLFLLHNKKTLKEVLTNTQKLESEIIRAHTQQPFLR